MKLIKTADLRDVLDSYNREEISYTKMVDILNEIANERLKVISVIHCYVSEAEQFFCWDKKGKLSKQCERQCNVCFRYERNNKKNCT